MYYEIYTKIYKYFRTFEKSNLYKYSDVYKHCVKIFNQ